MEKFLILAAAAAFVLACVAVATLSTRGERPGLRLPREDEIAGDDEDRMIASLTPPEPSPIDRRAPTLDLEPIEHDAGEAAGGERTGGEGTDRKTRTPAR